MSKSYAYSMFITNLLFILSSTLFAAADVVPLKDNILFAFERCKTLSVNLEKGQLAETVTSSFDLHCKQSAEKSLEYTCAIFDTGSSKKLSESVYTGGSNLGKALLSDKDGREIEFLIGKGFASFKSGPEQKVCAGIFIFERDALKQKSSSPKSGL